MPNALFHYYTKLKDLRFHQQYEYLLMIGDIKVIIRKQRLVLSLSFCAAIFSSEPLQAQWQMLVPNLLGPQAIDMSAMVHKGGLTWAGTTALFMSPDSGVTWSKRWNVPMGKDVIVDVAFYDNNIGLVCTLNGFLFRTDDQGLNWRQLNGFPGANTAAFLGSPSDIIITSGSTTVNISRDGGITWQSKVLDTYVQQVRALLGGSAMVFASNYTSLQGSIYKTTDYGVSWQTLPGKIDLDSYSFDVDPCDPRFIYVINEEGTTPTDNKGAIFISNDGGISFNQIQISPVQFFSGSIARTRKALFIQTTTNGISRSTDQGTTWQPIGGPNAAWDTRLLCAINSNIVLAADNTGSIWRTVNSGGDSIRNISPYESLALSPEELFTADTLVSCDSPIVATIHFHAILCKYPKILGQKITGADFMDYQIIQGLGDTLASTDSAILSFRPHGSGARTGEYTITLEDGTQVSVSLKGFGRGIIFIRPQTGNITLDTIGGYAEVPIRFTGFSQKEDLEVVLHYDSRMTYNSAISLTGIPLDIPGQAWLGRAKIRIPKSEMQLDTISGFAIFTVFPDGTDCFKVSLDSLSILNPFAPCTYSIGNPVEALICPPTGCGIMSLTNYILRGTMPQLFIQPNPNRGSALITSTVTLVDATVEVVDLLGSIRERKKMTLQKGLGARFTADHIPAGNYFIRISAGGFRFLLPLVIVQ